MKLRRTFKLSVLAILVLAAAAFALYRWNLSRRVDKALDAIRGQGYPVTLEELDAWYEEPPAGENVADALLDAVALVPDAPYKVESFLRGMFRPTQPRLVGPESRDLAIQCLAAGADVLKQLHSFTTFDKCRWPIDCTQGEAMPLPHLKPIAGGCRLLALDALMHGEGGDSEAAAQSMIAMIRLARTLDMEPVVVSQEMRQVCLSMAVCTLEGLLNRAVLPDAGTAQLAETLAGADNPEFLVRALAGRRCALVADARAINVADAQERKQAGFGRILNSPSLLYDTTPDWQHANTRGTSRLMKSYMLRVSTWDNVNDARDLFLQLAYKPLGFSDRDILTYLEIVNPLIDGVAMFYRERDAAEDRVAALVRELPWYYPMCLLCAEGMPNTACTEPPFAARIRIARVALAVERYRAARGGPPDSIDAVVPDFIDAIPQDPYSDDPVRYKRLPAGYVVYSIGMDGEDDGGAESENDEKAYTEGDMTFTVERL